VGAKGFCLAEHAFDIYEGSDITVSDPGIAAALRAVAEAVKDDGGTWDDAKGTKSGDARVGLLMTADNFARKQNVPADRLTELYSNACSYVQQFNPLIRGGTDEKLSACQQLIIAIENFVKTA